MKKLTLSRMHHLVRNHVEEMSGLQKKADAVPQIVEMRIFDRTTDADMEKLKEKTLAERNKYNQLVRRIDLMGGYIGYLKEELEKANHKYGVSSLLQKSRNNTQEIARLRQRLEKLQPDQRAARFLTMRDGKDHAPEQLDSLKDADYYKSSFTEGNRIFNLCVQVLPQSEQDGLNVRIEDIEAKNRKIADDIASLNQAKTLSVLDFEEYMNKISGA